MLIRPEDIVHDEASPLQAEILRLVVVSSQHDQAVGQHIGIRPNLGEIVIENQNSRITPHKQRSIPLHVRCRGSSAAGCAGRRNLRRPAGGRRPVSAFDRLRWATAGDTSANENPHHRAV